MKIIRATHLGMCFGVRDAIALALNESGKAPLTILGELVNNQTVVDDLDRRGVHTEIDPLSVTTRRVLVTAHGASERKMQQLKERGFSVLEATCPLVHFAHRAIKTLVEAGYHPVIIGKRDHVEVAGMTEDLEDYSVVLTPGDVDRLPARSRFGVVSQTTQPIDKVHQLLGLIRQRFPAAEVRFTDTVCQPTKQRQLAAIEVAQQCDIVVVVGGAHSNNTRELVQTCERHCSRVIHVQAAGDLRAEWFGGIETVGLTAGTSTPDSVIDAVERRLVEMQKRLRIECPSAADSLSLLAK